MVDNTDQTDQASQQPQRAWYKDQNGKEWFTTPEIADEKDLTAIPGPNPGASQGFTPVGTYNNIGASLQPGAPGAINTFNPSSVSATPPVAGPVQPPLPAGAPPAPATQQSPAAFNYSDWMRQMPAAPGIPNVQGGGAAIPQVPSNIQQLGAPSTADVAAQNKGFQEQYQGIAGEQAGINKQMQEIYTGQPGYRPPYEGPVPPTLGPEAGAIAQTQQLRERENQRQAQFWEAYNSMQKDADNQRQAIAQAKVDPNRFYNNLGTGGQIAAAIATAMVSYGQAISGRGGPNTAMEILDNAAKRDTQAQQFTYDQLRENYNLTREQMKDSLVMENVRQAEAAKKEFQIASDAQMRLQPLVMASQQADQKMRGLQFNMNLQQMQNDAAWKLADANMKLQQLGIQRAEAVGAASARSAQIQLEQARMKQEQWKTQVEYGLKGAEYGMQYGGTGAPGLAGVPLKYREDASKEMVKAQEFQSTKQSSLSAFDAAAAHGLSSVGGGGLDLPLVGTVSNPLPAGRQYAADAGALKTNLMKFEHLRSQPAMEQIDRITPYPTDSAATVKIKRQQLENLIDAGKPATPNLDQFRVNPMMNQGAAAAQPNQNQNAFQGLNKVGQ